MIEIYRESLAGVQFSDYQLATKLKAGVELSLVHEPKNKFDANCIGVYCDKHRIGFIKRADNQQLHTYRRAGIQLRAYCVAYNKTNPTWNMITVRVMAPRKVDKVASNFLTPIKKYNAAEWAEVRAALDDLDIYGQH